MQLEIATNLALLLALLGSKSVFTRTLYAEALSHESSAGVQETKWSSIGIRPELSKDSYAHRSAVECSCGAIDVRIASEVKGLGAFATSDIPFGTVVGKYDGETLDRKAVEARFWNKRNKTTDDIDWEQSRKLRGQGLTGNYLFELPNGSFVDAEDAEKSSWVRFMNHAETETVGCNVKAFIKTSIGDDDEEFPLMYAISDIKEGEELCWDYGGKFFV